MSPRRSWITEEFHDRIAALPPDRRGEVLDKVVSLFSDEPEKYSEYHVAAFDDVILKLIENASKEDRRRVSEILAPIKNAPFETVGNLACDEDIDIARPILTKSERIKPELLLELATTRGSDFMAAIALRKVLDPSVTNALVKRGDKKVLDLIAANKNAEVADGGLDQLRRQRAAAGREKRRSKRVTARYNIWLDLPGKEPLACQLADISAGGARIKLASTQALPPRFTIFLARARGNPRKCEVAWRTNAEAGLKFL
jgi:hypothetical protein